MRTSARLEIAPAPSTGIEQHPDAQCVHAHPAQRTPLGRRIRPLRDIALFAVLAWLVVTIPRRPFVGALAWVVFGIMYPHRLTWGPAYHFPFSQVIAILTLLSLLFTKEHRQYKGGPAAAVLIALFGWALVANVFAFYPVEAWSYVNRVFKVLLMTFILLLLLHKREQVIALVWCMVIALGFYGLKGGIFVLATGGNFMVNGPPDSAMAGNNSLGTGTVMLIPLIYYLVLVTRQRWVRLGLMVALPLCAVSVLGSYSRGALLAVAAMGALLWLRGRNKMLLAAGAIGFIAIAIPFMPEQWAARMSTIETYEEDLSAMQRLWAWETAYNVAKDRFPVGGGFEFQSPAVSAKYSPRPEYFHVAHSIYFQVLGSLGFVGLGLYLLFWALVWRQASWLRRTCRGKPEHKWAFDLASLVQVSLVAFLVGGAFIDIAFYDLPYYMFAALVGAYYAVARTASEQRNETAPAAASIDRKPEGSASIRLSR